MLWTIGDFQMQSVAQHQACWVLTEIIFSILSYFLQIIMPQFSKQLEEQQ